MYYCAKVNVLTTFNRKYAILVHKLCHNDESYQWHQAYELTE